LVEAILEKLRLSRCQVPLVVARPRPVPKKMMKTTSKHQMDPTFVQIRNFAFCIRGMLGLCETVPPAEAPKAELIRRVGRKAMLKHIEIGWMRSPR